MPVEDEPDNAVPHGVQVTYGITREGGVLMSVHVMCGGDIDLASALAEQLQELIHTVWEAANQTPDEVDDGYP